MRIFQIGWYIIYTRPRHEKKTANDLLMMGIETFVPVTIQRRKWQDRMKSVESVLFPSYVFVKLENASQFFNSSKAFGFVSYVKTGKLIAKVGDHIISNIKRAVNESGEIHVSEKTFFPGAKVIIREGAFNGLECEIVNFEGKEKVLLRVDLLNRCLLINLPAKILSVA